MLNFDSIKGRKTIIGGAQGKLRVKLTGFTVGPDRNGAPNYKFEMELLDFPGSKPEKYNCGESFYSGVISNIAQQLGYEKGNQASDEEVLTKASKEEFYIWKENGYTNFYDREAYLQELAEQEREEAVQM